MNSPVEKTLFAEFAPADEKAWRAAAEESLEGAPFEKKLITKTAEGIDLQPLYSRASTPPPVWQARPPGFAPFVRGTDPLGAREQAWLICQEPAGTSLAAPQPCARKRSGRLAVTPASFCRSDPAAAFRGLAKILPSASCCAALSAINACFSMYTSPRTSNTAGAFPRSIRGMSAMWATLAVTSSPTCPSPRVAARTSLPSS